MEEEGAAVPQNALYYPHLGFCVPVEIYGVRVNASHDAGALCHENRSFLDVALWRQNPRIAEVVAPHPPCKRLNGTRAAGGNVVIGMVKNPVNVTLLRTARKTRRGNIVAGQPVVIQLRNVLLVKNLPVPLHISVKAEPEFIATGAFGQPPFYMWTKDGTVPDNMKLEKRHFPLRYRDNPYWTPNDNRYADLTRQYEELSRGLAKCMAEGDGKDARSELALKHGWHPIRQIHGEVESWEHDETGNRIDYYPMRDGAFLTMKTYPQEGHNGARGSPNNKYLHQDNIGGNDGLAKIFRNIRYHSGKLQCTQK